ncbi:hypothetical protein B0H11DRAFT_435090 [Mycena galericulata]|nr:hypothetical protein B0H11DRAFT_435090 [Mycena galericulata]
MQEAEEQVVALEVYSQARRQPEQVVLRGFSDNSVILTFLRSCMRSRPTTAQSCSRAPSRRAATSSRRTARSFCGCGCMKEVSRQRKEAVAHHRGLPRFLPPQLQVLQQNPPDQYLNHSLPVYHSSEAQTSNRSTAPESEEGEDKSLVRHSPRLILLIVLYLYILLIKLHSMLKSLA